MPEEPIPTRLQVPRPRRERKMAVAASHKFLLFLSIFLGYLISYPYVQGSGLGYYGFRMFAIAITLLSVYAVSFRRGVVFVALVLAVPALVGHLRMDRWDTSALSLLTVSLTLTFDALIIAVIFRRVFIHGQPNSETISGALCIYLLVGFGFASIYNLVATVQRHAFYLDPIANAHTHPNRFDFIYYSFGTLTSLGASGITAVSDPARSVTVLEAVIGVLYLAVLISRLVSAYRRELKRAAQGRNYAKEENPSEEEPSPLGTKSATKPKECSRSNCPAWRKS